MRKMEQLFYAKRLAEKCCVFSPFPFLLYIHRRLSLPSLCVSSHNDGLGEGFEQRPIDVDGRKMFAHLWQWDNWDIQTEQERFGPELAEGLPEMCFSVLPGEGKLICIKRGERGFLSSDWDTGDPIKNRKIADFNNEKLGVSKAQEEAMRTGSMFGWDCPGADPARYAQYERPQIGGMKLE